MRHIQTRRTRVLLVILAVELVLVGLAAYSPEFADLPLPQRLLFAAGFAAVFSICMGVVLGLMALLYTLGIGLDLRLHRSLYPKEAPPETREQ